MNQPFTDSRLFSLAADTIRMLAVDAVEKAKSGHPGMPMGAADMALVLWTRFLRFNPQNPTWPGRDRFILSAGHGSMLQYALLHLFGFDLPLEEIQRFRQWGSKTPGHPEYGVTPGVELTTGPLGQGFANGVGMAIAAKMVQCRFSVNGFSPSGMRIFGIVSDGDLMEGISSEATALAGHLCLDNIVYLYDSNDITIEGKTDLAWSENVKARFEANNWNVLTAEGHNVENVDEAIQKAIDCKDKPSLIICHTHIGKGSPGKQDSELCHGSPLGEEEARATKENINWPLEPAFHIPGDVAEFFRQCAETKKAECDAWQEQFAIWKNAYPDLAEQWESWQKGSPPANLAEQLLEAVPDKDDATRFHSGAILQKAAKIFPNLMGGSADLGPSNKSIILDAKDICCQQFEGRNFHFGIREHAMGAIVNGMALYGGIKSYAATFLVFADYMRPAIRLAALMGIPSIFLFSHDSFHVGEDGPTHQPVEHLASLRVIPNLVVFRPADGIETAMSWAYALARKNGPTTLALTRQKVPRLERTEGWQPEEVLQGGYVISDSKKSIPDGVIIATGSEVALAIAAQKLLQEDGLDFRVVSMPCLEIFESQPEEVRKKILPTNNERVVVMEAGREAGWGRYLGPNGLFIGMDRFGASAPAKELAEQFGFVPEKVAEKIKNWMED